MNCRKIRGLINIYLDDEANSKQKELVLLHTQTCKECNFIFNETQKLNNLLTSVPAIKHPSNLHSSIMSRVTSDSCKEKKAFFAFPVSAWAGVATLILVIALSSMLIFRDKSEGTSNIVTKKPETNIALAKPEILIVSPKEDAVIEEKNVDISAVIDSVGTTNIRVILDGKDVTDATEISKDFLIYTSDTLSDGYHKVVINADDEKGKSITQRSWKFFVIPSERVSIEKPSKTS
jgi:hypothetical protein